MKIPTLAFLAMMLPTMAMAQSNEGKTLAVFEPIGIGIEGPQLETTGDLFRQEFTKLGYRVTPRGGMPEGTCADELCASEKGKTIGVQEAVIVKLSRLDTKLLVLAAIVDVPSGRVEFSDRATASTMDDMDTLAPRLVRSMSSRIPFDSTLNASNVTANESRDQQRQKSLFTTGLRLSSLIPIGGSYAGAPSLYGIEWVNYYDVRRYSVEAAFGYRGTSGGNSTSVSELYADLGGYYYFSDEDVAPFLGGGVGIHNINASYLSGVDPVTNTPATVSQNLTGAALWVGGGVTLLRSADVHVVGLAKYAVDLININGQPANGVMLGVAVTYTKHNACCMW